MVKQHHKNKRINNCKKINYNKKYDTFSMKIRVPYALEKIHSKYCEINNLTIPTYLHRHLLREIEKHNIKSSTSMLFNTQEKSASSEHR